MMKALGIKKLLIFAGLVIVIFLVFTLASWTTLNKSETPQEKGEPGAITIPRPEDFEKDYSRINNIVPGESTRKDVERINGKPEGEKTTAGRTYLYYSTPSLDYQNIVALEDDRVVYALEKVFEGNRGEFKDYTERYGNPSLTLYDQTSEPVLEWSVFLEEGVTASHLDEYISWILYFVPQGEKGFMTTAAQDLGLTQEHPGENLEDFD